MRRGSTGRATIGLDAATLCKTFPSLIYCSVTGFGQTGPYASHAGYVFMTQGMSGIMDLTGEPDVEPQKMSVALADISTCLSGVTAVQSALLQRQTTGHGQHVPVRLHDDSYYQSVHARGMKIEPDGIRVCEPHSLQ